MSSMNRHEVKLTREQLYESVWTKPTTHLARELGISDVALAKICRKLGVPKPGPGYWRAVEFGRRPATPLLPKAREGVPAYVVIHASATWLRKKGSILQLSKESGRSPIPSTEFLWPRHSGTRIHSLSQRGSHCRKEELTVTDVCAHVSALSVSMFESRRTRCTGRF